MRRCSIQPESKRERFVGRLAPSASIQAGGLLLGPCAQGKSGVKKEARGLFFSSCHGERIRCHALRFPKSPNSPQDLGRAAPRRSPREVRSPKCKNRRAPAGRDGAGSCRIARRPFAWLPAAAGCPVEPVTAKRSCRLLPQPLVTAARIAAQAPVIRRGGFAGAPLERSADVPAVFQRASAAPPQPH